MRKPFDETRILRTNPKVDPKLVREFAELERQLERLGVDIKPKYRLLPSLAIVHPLPHMPTTSKAQTIKVETPYDEVPYTEEVFQKLAALPNKAPDLPYDGDDDL